MCFKKENEIFNENYPTDADEIEYYTNKVEYIFREIGIDNSYTRCGIERNVKEWYSAKQPIFEILRKHENWNEEAKAVVFLRDEVRKANGGVFRRDFIALQDYIANVLAKHQVVGDYSGCRALMCIRDSADKEISDDEACGINSLGYYREIKAGMKRSRVINAIYKDYPVNGDKKIDATKFVDEHEEGSRDYQSYNKLFAKVADDTNPLKIKRITVLSANICDYLLMSNGNSWSSCHFINSSGAYNGCYKAGTLSYSNDGTSMVFYTLSSDYNGNQWFFEPKITRQMFFYQNGNLLQSRLYPKGCDAEGVDYKDYRAVVQDIISNCLGVPNLWKKLNGDEWLDINTYDDSFHYKDYEEFPSECVMSYNKEFKDEINEGIEIGGRSYCVDCGDERSYYGNDDCRELQCNCCAASNRCERCGCHYDQDDMHEIDGDWYCEDCCFWCEIHEEWEIRYSYRGEDFKREVEINGTWYTMCEAAFDDEVVYCDKCGEYEWKNEAMYVDELDEILCRDCYEDFMNRKEEENEDEIA